MTYIPAITGLNFYPIQTCIILLICITSKWSGICAAAIDEQNCFGIFDHELLYQQLCLFILSKKYMCPCR